MTCNPVILLRHDFDIAAAIGHQGAIAHRFGGKNVLTAQLKSENLAGNMKGFDLASAIAEELAHPHHAGNDFVETIGIFPLGEDFTSLVDMHNGTGDAERLRTILTGHPTSAGLESLGRGSDRQLHRHRRLRSEVVPLPSRDDGAGIFGLVLSIST